MLEHLPEELRAALAAGLSGGGRRRPRFRVKVGAELLPVRRLWADGFALAPEHARALRGHVDLYDGGRHLARCLIIASVTEGDEVICEFKRATAPAEGPARDFAEEEGGPRGLLPRR